MWNRKAVRGAGRAIALAGTLALVAPALAGGLDDPGGPAICGESTLASSPVKGVTAVPPSPGRSRAVVAQLLVWRWIATLLLH